MVYKPEYNPIRLRDRRTGSVTFFNDRNSPEAKSFLERNKDVEFIEEEEKLAKDPRANANQMQNPYGMGMNPMGMGMQGGFGEWWNQMRRGLGGEEQNGIKIVPSTPETRTRQMQAQARVDSMLQDAKRRNDEMQKKRILNNPNPSTRFGMWYQDTRNGRMYY